MMTDDTQGPLGPALSLSLFSATPIPVIISKVITAFKILLDIGDIIGRFQERSERIQYMSHKWIVNIEPQPKTILILQLDVC